jgi:hypothetical protein
VVVDTNGSVASIDGFDVVILAVGVVRLPVAVVETEDVVGLTRLYVERVDARGDGAGVVAAAAAADARLRESRDGDGDGEEVSALRRARWKEDCMVVVLCPGCAEDVDSAHDRLSFATGSGNLDRGTDIGVLMSVDI